MEYAKDEGVDWRKKIEEWIVKELGHAVFNPNIESEKYLKKRLPGHNLRELKFSDVQKFRQIVKGIVTLDSKEIADRTDYVICYWDSSAQRGAGTKGELTIAHFFDKPVYMVTSMKQERIPGWILGCTSEIFGSFHELLTFLKQKYRNASARSFRD